MRVLPADERLDADDVAALQVELGLVVHDDLAGVERAAELGEAAQAARARVAGPRLGEAVGAALRLGGVKRGVGAAQERSGVAAVGGAEGDAGGRLDVHRGVVAEPELLLQRLAHAGGERRRLVVAGDGGGEDGEGVAAEMRERVERADGAREALRDLDEHAVAEIVAQDLVDLVEAVEVEEDEREAAAVDGAVELVAQGAAVRQAGERVVQLEVAALGELRVERGDLGDDAAQRDGPAAAVALDGDALVDLDALAVGVDHAVLEVQAHDVEVGDRVLELLDHALAVLVVQEGDPEVGIVEPLLGAVAQQLLAVRADVVQGAVAERRPRDGRHLVQQHVGRGGVLVEVPPGVAHAGWGRCAGLASLTRDRATRQVIDAGLGCPNHDIRPSSPPRLQAPRGAPPPDPEPPRRHRLRRRRARDRPPRPPRRPPIGRPVPRHDRGQVRHRGDPRGARAHRHRRATTSRTPSGRSASRPSASPTGWASRTAIGPWAEDAAAAAGEKPELLKDIDGVQYEKIAALQPDLIVGAVLGHDEGRVRQALPDRPRARAAGGRRRLGHPLAGHRRHPREGRRRSRRRRRRSSPTSTARIAKDKEEHPEFEGKTASFAMAFEGIWVYGESDPRSRLLTSLGFELSPELVEPRGGHLLEEDLRTSRPTCSTSTRSPGSARRPTRQELDANRLYTRLKVHEEGRDFFIEAERPDKAMNAIGFQSPLSIAQSLDVIVPALRGRPGRRPRHRPLEG